MEYQFDFQCRVCQDKDMRFTCILKLATLCIYIAKLTIFDMESYIAELL